MYSLYSAGRDEEIFPDVLKFDPDRWRKDDSHAFTVRPFGFGPRACYGKAVCNV
jgi:cytochrome P450